MRGAPTGIRLAAATIAALALLSGCGTGEAPAETTPPATPTTAAASPSADSPSTPAATSSPTETGKDTSDEDSRLSIETVPAKIGNLIAFEDEISGISYSPSGGPDTPGIHLMSIGDPDNFDVLHASLEDSTVELSETAFCDASTTEPTCYFTTPTEAFFVGGDASISVEEVEQVTLALAQQFS